MKCRIRQSNLANPCHQAGESHRKENEENSGGWFDRH
jgi:hypothetical protein